MPRIIGIRIRTRRGFARAHMLKVSPGIMKGTKSGISTTVATIVNGMNAAEKLTSARAFLTKMGKKGATGARLVINSPRAMEDPWGLFLSAARQKPDSPPNPSPGSE